MATNSAAMLKDMERRTSPAMLPVKFVFPDLNQPAAAAPALAPRAARSCLRFDERELAQAMAASAASADQRARAASRQELDHMLHLTCTRIADQLADLEHEQRRREAAKAAELAKLIAIFAEACLTQIAGDAMAQTLCRAAEQVMEQIKPGSQPTIGVAYDMVEPLGRLLQGRPLADVALEGRRDLQAGEVVVSWEDGWAEWSLDRLRGHLAMSLAGMASAGAPAPSDAQIASVEHGHAFEER